MKGPAKAESSSPSPAPREARAGGLKLSPTACLVLALALFSTATMLALRQPLRPDPYKESSALAFDWWRYPLEWNPPGRLPRIERDLKDVYAVPGTQTVYAVGELGTVIVSEDAGETWQPAASRTPAPTPSPSATNTPANSNAATPSSNANSTGPTPNSNDRINTNSNPTGGANSNNAAQRRNANGLALPSLDFLDLIPTANAAELRATDAQSRSSQMQQGPPPSPTATPRPAAPTPTPPPRSPAATPTPRAAQPIPSPTPRATATPQLGSGAGTGAVLSGERPTPVSFEGETLSAVAFGSELDGFVVDDDGELFGTSDGGRSWFLEGGVGVSIIPHALRDSSATGFRQADGFLTWVVRGNRPPVFIRLWGDGVILDVTFGATRRAVGEGVLRNATDIFFDGGEGWSITEGDGLFHSSNGGQTWGRMNTNLPSSDRLRSLNFLNILRGWAVGDGGEIVTTADGGLTWQQQASGTSQNLKSVNFQPDGQRGWAVGDGGVILRTEDGGATWIHQTQDARATVPARGVYYFRLLPPWYYASWLAVALLLWPVRRTAVVDEAEEPEASVADVLVSDRPLEDGDADTIGFRSIALGLSRFLRNENTKPPLTIAVTGEWGTGKSSLMNLLRADLRKYDFRPVWFNAWHHQKEEHLLASLLQNVRLQAVPRWWRPEGIIFRLRLLRIRGARQWGPALLVLLFLAVAVFYELLRQDANTYLAAYFKSVASLFYGSSAPEVSDWTKDYLSRLPLLVSVLTFAGTVWRGATAFGVNPASLMASMSRGVRVRDLDAQTSFRQKFAAEFKDVTEALGARSMLIFIDDLDRCRPENVVETLEAVNFLVSSGECFVVIGMARERVEPCVALSFKDVAAEMPDGGQHLPAATPTRQEERARQKRLEYARQYLDKLINIEVPVPVPTPEQSRDILLANARRAEEPDEMEKAASRLLGSGAGALARDYWRLLQWWVALVLLLSGCYALASFLARPVPLTDAPARPSAQPSPTFTPTPTQTPQPTPTASPSRTATPTPSPAASPTPNPREGLPALTPGKRSVMLAAVPLALAVLAVFWVGLWVLTRRPGLVVKDSPDFVEALTIWHPLVFARSSTPRSVKRFMNRVRYLAMRQRPQADRPPSWRRLLAGLTGKSGAGDEGRKKGPEGKAPIPDELLVALAAIQHFDERWLSDNTVLLSNPVPENPQRADMKDAGFETLNEWLLFQEAKDTHAEKFGWDAAAVTAAREEFRRLSKVVQVN